MRTHEEVVGSSQWPLHRNQDAERVCKGLGRRLRRCDTEDARLVH